MENLLEQYNPHWQRAFKYDLIDRPAYAEKFLPLIDRREILVVKGIRLSGKSSLLNLLINYLIKKKRV
ncbi:MAG: ATP-binding protein, partial [Calditrichaeota bacterium]|nr:ATP-binding protein [Calditrichota bacterium]